MVEIEESENPDLTLEDGATSDGYTGSTELARSRLYGYWKGDRLTTFHLLFSLEKRI